MRSAKAIYIACALLVPLCANADASFYFVTDAQTAAPGTPSNAITIAASGPASATTCILLSSNSSTGQFSSSATNWSSVVAVTMSKNTSNRSFFYKDSSNGSFTITARIAPKPESVSASCTSWADASASVSATLTQSIQIGSDSVGTPDDGSNTTQQNQTSVQTQTGQAQTTIISNTGGAAETVRATIQTTPVVVAGAGSFFSASASDSGGAKGNNVRFLWNFGDGSIQEGQTVFHAYAYPGTYVVMLTASAPGDSAGIVRTTVEASPARIGVLAEPDGSVVLSNQSPYELNIGLWSITSGSNTFLIPQDTILVGDMSIRFAPSVMRMNVGNDATLRYPNNTVAAAAVPQQQTQATGPVVVSAAPNKSTVSQTKKSPAPSAASLPDTSLVAAVGASHAPWPLWAWGLGLLGVVCIGLGAASYLLSRRVETKGTDEEFEIE